MTCLTISERRKYSTVSMVPLVVANEVATKLKFNVVERK